MRDSQQDSKRKTSYEPWTKEQTNILLELMIDVARRGWRDNSGIFSKTTVEERLLHVLNEKLWCNKTYSNYQSRLKWFKNRWTFYSNLLRFSSGFGYDPITKKFTASDEVWNAYLEAHSKYANLRYRECPDYENLLIAVRNGVAVGKNSFELGSATDANTLGDDENRDSHIEDLTFDVENEVFVALSQDELPSSGSTPPSMLPEVPEGSIQRRNQPKRSRTQYEATSGSTENIMAGIKKLSTTCEGVHNLLLKRDSILEKKEKEICCYTTWDAIKEIPNLDEDTRLKAFDLLDTKFRKDGFLKMTVEERANWIAYKIREYGSLASYFTYFAFEKIAFTCLKVNIFWWIVNLLIDVNF
ncbi:hypothetical protein C2S51_004556 [Perilla frutescens var. frutescens]|nr:hypothetical protein C2S51_004556 [Perilla frutescens var. frutescens]